MFDKDNNELSKLSKSQRAKLTALVSGRFKDSSNQILDLRKEVEEAWDYYTNNKPKEKNKGDRRGLRLGLIPRSVDSVLAILHSACFPPDEQFFKGTPKNAVAAQYQELYEKYKLDNFAESNVTEDFRAYLLSLCLTPAAAMAVHWVKKTKRKVSYEAKKLNLLGVEISLPMMGLKETIDEDYVCWEGTKPTVLDFNDWRVDPSARSIEESWFIRRWYEPTHKIEQDYGMRDVKAYKEAFDVSDSDRSAQLKEYGILAPIGPDEESASSSEALLMVCYDDFSVDGKVYENYVALTLNGSELIWFGKNDYDHGRKPFIVHSLIPLPNQIYGLSLVKHAIPSAAVIDSLTQLSLEVMKFSARPIFEVDMKEPAFRKQRQVEAGETIPVKQPGAIRQIPVNVANLSFVSDMVATNMDNIREVTGASPMFTGEDFANSPANITAFQVDQHVQGAHTRFQAMLNNFTNAVLEPFLAMSYENDKQFKTQTEWVDIGDSYKDLTPDLIKQMDFRWTITSIQANLAKAKKIATLKELMFTLLPPLVENGIVSLSQQHITLDQFALMKDLFITGGLTNADDLLKMEAMMPQQQPLTQPQEQGDGLDGVQQLLGAQTGGAGQIPPAA